MLRPDEIGRLTDRQIWVMYCRKIQKSQSEMSGPTCYGEHLTILRMAAAQWNREVTDIQIESLKNYWRKQGEIIDDE